MFQIGFSHANTLFVKLHNWGKWMTGSGTKNEQYLDSTMVIEMKLTWHSPQIHFYWVIFLISRSKLWVLPHSSSRYSEGKFSCLNCLIFQRVTSVVQSTWKSSLTTSLAQWLCVANVVIHGSHHMKSWVQTSASISLHKFFCIGLDTATQTFEVLLTLLF